MNEDEAVSLGLGGIVGFGTNYLWEKYQGYGYGKEVFKLGKTPIGQDDLIETGIGSIITIYGLSEKDVTIRAFGIGFIGGIVLDKILEHFNL